MSNLTKEQRSARDRSIPKCSCGNNLSRDRQERGIKECPSCEINESQELEFYVDELITHFENKYDGGCWMVRKLKSIKGML